MVKQTNTNKPDPSLTNVRTGEYRKVAKKPDEGLDFSSHIVIKLIPLESQQLSLLLMEGYQGISPAEVKKFFNHLLHLCKKKQPDKFRQPHINGAVENGKQTTFEVSFTFNFFAHMADDLEFQLNKGNFIFQELVMISKEPKFDNDGFTEVRNETTLKVQGYPYITRIKNFMSKHKGNSIRLKLKAENNKTRQMTLDCNADIKYVKKESFECDNQNRSHTEITNEIIKKMRDFL